MARTDTTDHLALILDLQVEARGASAPGGQCAFKATIEVREVNLCVGSIDADLTEAIRGAAQLSAERLCELGYAVTAADVLGALHDSSEHEQPVSRFASGWN
jgi:hypothetical protein